MIKNAISVPLDQATLRVLYDALRSKYADTTSNRFASSSQVYDAGIRKGLDMAINVLIQLNDGAPAPTGGTDGS